MLILKAYFFLKIFAVAFKKLFVSSVYAASAEHHRFIFFKDFFKLWKMALFLEKCILKHYDTNKSKSQWIQ